nr:T9SS type A sorting domain-containing protein [Saprospiraceae bacterium]
MRFIHSSLITLFLLVSFGSLQSQDFLKVIAFNPSETNSKELLHSPFDVEEINIDSDADISQAVREGLIFTLNPERYHKLLSHNGNLIQLRVPYESNRFFTLQLKEVNIFQDKMKIFTASNPSEPIENFTARFFWGVVQGQPNSMVTISLFEDEMVGFISFDGQTYSIAKMENDRDRRHIIYNNRDLLSENNFTCHVDENEHFKGSPGEIHSRMSDSSNCVNVYVEVDHDIYQGKGSVGSASSYVLGAFSQVFLLYADESIETNVSEILVWDVPSPYTGPGSTDYLYQFRDELNGNYNGDIAHLVSYSASGGVAYLDVVCSGFYGVAFSSISSGYNNVPTYSWTVEVIAHEMGHNLGSWHTHSCNWNGAGNDAIDGCGPQAGYSEGCDGPLPSAGTVMSYCHLVGGVGIDFNEGFGPQPGDRMRDKVYDATCLEPCSTDGHDAGITDFTVPDPHTCDDTFEPEVVLFNFGTEELTSVDIYYSINGGPDLVINWTGNLGTLESETITLPQQTFSFGSNDIYAYTDQPNGEDDSDPSNDDYLHEFVVAETPFTLTIVLDDYPNETSWDIVDATGEVLFSEGPYSGQQPGSTVVENFCLEEVCYDFTIYDSYGDGICCAFGNGSYELINDNTGQIVASGGQFDFEETTSFCVDNTLYDINGSVTADIGDPLEDAEITIVSDGEEENKYSNSVGYYESEVLENSDNVMTVDKADLTTSGLSTMDLLMIQKNITHTDLLIDPYEIIAADVNMDNNINTIDLILLHQRILGIIDEYPHGQSWIFIPESHVFNNPQDPLNEGWPESIEINDIGENFLDQDWVSVKIGDVNGDYFPSNQRFVQHDFPLLISSQHRSLKSTQANQIDFYSGTSESISGFQLEFYNPYLWSKEDINIVSDLPNMSAQNIFVDHKTRSIRVSWWTPEPVDVENEEYLFSFRLQSEWDEVALKKDFKLIERGFLWSPEIYNADFEIFRPQLDWVDVDPTGNYALYQNQPNPFTNQTIIPFKLPYSMEVNLEIWDESGKLIRGYTLEGKGGMNQFSLKVDESMRGVYYYRLKAVNWESTKMLIISN